MELIISCASCRPPVAKQIKKTGDKYVIEITTVEELIALSKELKFPLIVGYETSRYPHESILIYDTYIE